MSNKQFDYVEKKANDLHINLNQCPTCGAKPTVYEEMPDVTFWPDDATFTYSGEEYFCHCEQQIELMRHYILGNIPKHYWTLGIDNWYGDDQALQHIQEYLDNWDKYKSYGIGVKIYSPTLGTGKTMLSIIIGKALIQHQEHVIFIPFRDIIGLYKLPDDSRQEMLDRLRETPILILDDVVPAITEAQRDFMAIEFEDIIRYRMNGNTINIVTTNLLPNELEKEYPRCFSVMESKQIPINVDGIDHRTNGDQRLLDIELALNNEHRPIC